MITIYDSSNTAYIIRPCPFVNISWNSSFTEGGKRIGGSYDITLTGTILAHAGNPIFSFDNRNKPENGISWSPSYYPNGCYTKPGETVYPPNDDNAQKANLHSILGKQIALRELFSKHCQKIEVASVYCGDADGIITFYPKFISIDFAEGQWVERCDYTVNLVAKFLFDKGDKVIGSSSYTGGGSDVNKTVDDLQKELGGFVDDFQETWSLEPEDGVGNTFNPISPTENITRIYRLTRNISAKGSDLDSSFGKCNTPGVTAKRPHEQARAYVVKYLEQMSIPSSGGGSPNSHDDYLALSHPLPFNRAISTFGSGVLNLHAINYGGYNHSRTENFDVGQGSYSIQDTWILSSGNSHENYTLALSSSTDDPNGKVTIDGTIKGLTSIPASGNLFGGTAPSTFNTAYENAINKYREITNQGQFGNLAWTFQRAQRAAGGISLNSTPLSVAVSTNEFTGEINYTIEYDDRPSNIFSSGVSSEAVSVTDTYPGDMFAVIPVIGRMTGPVLQYIGGRTEYQRSINIDLIVSYDKNNPNRSKPSLNGNLREKMRLLINQYSPAREPGIRKYFVSPPQETWNPKDGSYSLNITWTYELNY